MKYKDLFEATASISNTIYQFEGHKTDASHNCFMFNQLAKGLDFLNKENSAKSIQFQVTLWNNGDVVPSELKLYKSKSIFSEIEIELNTKKEVDNV